MDTFVIVKRITLAYFALNYVITILVSAQQATLVNSVTIAMMNLFTMGTFLFAKPVIAIKMGRCRQNVTAVMVPAPAATILRAKSVTLA